MAAQTIEFVDELIEAENVFLILTLGSPNTLAVYDKINEEYLKPAGPYASCHRIANSKSLQN